MAILELRSVTKTYGDFYASKEISFSVEQGEFVTLLELKWLWQNNIAENDRWISNAYIR